MKILAHLLLSLSAAFTPTLNGANLTTSLPRKLKSEPVRWQLIWDKFKPALSGNTSPEKLLVFEKSDQIVHFEDRRVSVLHFGEAKGKNVLVVLGESGGTLCCATVKVFDLDFRGREMSALQVQGSAPEWQHLIVNGVHEYTLTLGDYTFAFWHGPHSDAAIPNVVMRFDGVRLAVAQDLMRTAPPAPESVQAEGQELMQDSTYWKTLRVGVQGALAGSEFPGRLTARVLQLLYAGHADAARRFLDSAWRDDFGVRKEVYEQEFRKQLAKSPFWRELIASGARKDLP